jgi:hypothetical protein
MGYIEKYNFNAKFVIYLICILAFCYGYEIFNFNLTIDEEIHAGSSIQWREWIAQGRWGMAALNYYVVRYPIAPVVSASIGIVGTAFGLALFFQEKFALNPIKAFVSTAVAISIPTFSFTFTFGTLAYGIGVAFLSVNLAFHLITSKNLGLNFIGCILASFAVSIYQTFIFVVFLLIVFQLNNIAEKNVDPAKQLGLRFLVFFVGALTFYFLINYVCINAFGIDTKYVSQFIDFKGLMNDPVARIGKSSKRVFEILALRPNYFGVDSYWLLLLFVVSLFSILSSSAKSSRIFLVNCMAIVAVCSTFVLADAIATGGAPIRSMIYLPVGVGIIVAIALSNAGAKSASVLVALSALAVVGNSQISNHLFMSSVSAESKDRLLAHDIIKAVREIRPELTNYSILKLEVIGGHDYASSGIQSKSETFGASFFEWDSGNRHRIAAYLRLNGIATVAASEEDRMNVVEVVRSMPVWPRDGWLRIEKDTLILKFGSYSLNQRAGLCADGIPDFCI